MKTIEASKGKWEFIYDCLGFPPKTGNAHYKGPCPVCGKTNHFRFDDRSGDGDWICTCSNGKGIALVQEVFQMTFADACKKVDSIINNVQEKVQVGGCRTKEDVEHEKFLKLSNIKGTEVQDYLESRKIYVLPDDDVIRYSPKEEHDYIARTYFSCMTAKAVSHIDTFVYKHMTFLINGKKIDLDPDKKIITVTESGGGAVVKLFKHAFVLGVAEGIETALSARQIYDVPVWSTLNTSFMKKFVCPKGVKKLLIFADNDLNLSGQAAAYECARRNMLLTNDLKEIVILWPNITGDFNDMLISGNFNIQIYKYTK